ncbi:MAG: hypothetical protein V4684_17195, partial [Pseudomonadota bacterium]
MSNWSIPTSLASPSNRDGRAGGCVGLALARVCLAAAVLLTACGGSGSDPPSAKSFSPLAQQKDRGPLAMPATTSALDASTKG